MERLTARWGNNQAVPRKFDLADVFDVSKTTWDELTNILNKLASYEGTGLTPDAVEQMQKGNAELKELLRLAITDLHYLSQCSESGFVCFKCSYHTDGHRGCKSECEYRWDKCDRAREAGVEV